MFSLEIIIPIIVVAAVCAVYIILRGRRDERRAREAGEKLRPIPMDDPLVAGGAAIRPGAKAGGQRCRPYGAGVQSRCGEALERFGAF